MLDEFTQSYLETALWASTDDNGYMDTYSISDLSQEALRICKEDCRVFQEENWEYIQNDLKRAG